MTPPRGKDICQNCGKKTERIYAPMEVIGKAMGAKLFSRECPKCPPKKPRLSYALCKELRDAGFPQTAETMFCGENSIVEDWLYGYSASAWYCSSCRGRDRDKHATIPMLPFLIEACGEKLHNLTKFKDEWFTNFRMLKSKMGMSKWDSKGETIEEAVAKLWLTPNQSAEMKAKSQNLQQLKSPLHNR